VFGSVALAIVVLPEEVTSAGSLSAGFAGLMTVLSFAPGVAVQPFARRLRDPLTGAVAGLACGAAGTAVGIAAVAGPGDQAGHVLAGVAAVLLGLAYGLCLVSGLRQAENIAAPGERGAVTACYYAVAYLGFATPYLVAGLGAAAGKTGAFVALTAIIAGLAVWTAWYAARVRNAAREAGADTSVSCQAQDRSPAPRLGKRPPRSG
jgi:dipeptide/tripeptide permease